MRTTIAPFVRVVIVGAVCVVVPVLTLGEEVGVPSIGVVPSTPAKRLMPTVPFKEVLREKVKVEPSLPVAPRLMIVSSHVLNLNGMLSTSTKPVAVTVTAPLVRMLARKRPSAPEPAGLLAT